MPTPRDNHTQRLPKRAVRPGKPAERSRRPDRATHSTDRPSIGALLDIDRIYRFRAKLGVLSLIQHPKQRSRPTPVLRANRGGWRFLAHRKRNSDSLVVYYRREPHERIRRRFVYTASSGSLAGKRLVRGRETECRTHYRNTLHALEASATRAKWAAAVGAVLCLAGIPLGLVDRSGFIQDEPVAAAKIHRPFAVVDQSNVAEHDERNSAVAQTNTIGGSLDALAGLTTESATSTGAGASPSALGERPAMPRHRNASLRSVARPDDPPAVGRLSGQQKPPAPAPEIADRVDMATNAGGPIVVSTSRTTESGGADGFRAGGQAVVNDHRYAASPTVTAFTDVETKTGRGARSSRQKKQSESSMNTAFRQHRQSNPGLNHDPRKHDSYWEMDMRSALAGDLLSTSGKIAFSSFDPSMTDGYGDEQHRAMRFGLGGNFQRFRYGTSYRSAGKTFAALKQDRNKLKRNREVWQAWGARQIGDVNVMASYIQRRSDLHDDPSKPRFNDQQARVTLTHTLTQWPYLGYSLSYGTGTRVSSDEPDGYRPFEGSTQELSGSVYYSANTWNASLDSYQFQTDEDGTEDRGNTMRGLSVTGSYYPSKHFSISPSLSLDNEFYQNDGSHTDRRSFSLALAKSFTDSHVNFTAYASHYSERNPTWNLDAEGIYAEAGLVRSLKTRDEESTKSIGLHLTYNRYDDHIYESSSVDETALWLIFRHDISRLPYYRPNSSSSLFDEQPR